MLARERREETNKIKSQLRRVNQEKDERKKIFLENELERLCSVIFEGQKIRSKADNLNNSEHPSTYFKKLEKRNAQNKLINKISTASGDVTDQKEILVEVHSFYSTLYSSQPIDTKSMDEVLDDLPRLSPKESESCEGPITRTECEEALKTMKSSKTPGCDGLPTEFYKKYFHIFGDSFIEVLNKCFTNGKLSPSCRLATITLLCKDKEKANDLAYWRPISLLNTDVKILSKVLCNRLKKVIGSIVQKDQTCGIPGRSITDNLHLIRNVVDYVNQKNLRLVLLSLDFKKAFDNVSHEFLFKVLKSFGFGSTFIKFVQLLYTDIKSQVIVNGFCTKSFPIRKGVRQGCGLSPLLFVLVVEVLGKLIRKNPKSQDLNSPDPRKF